jgi:hypothetical protein
MGNENSAGKKAFKPIIIAIAAVFAIVAVFFVVSSFVDVSGPSDETLTPGIVQASTAQGQGNTVKKETTTTAKNDIANSPVVDQNSNDAGYTKVVVPSTTVEKVDASKKFPSTVLKGFSAVKSWKASSVISSVTAEKVIVSLPVYEGGVKTSDKEDAYLYIAEVTTRPSRLSVLAASQFTKFKVTNMATFVRGYESKAGQDILFASTNEMCARDVDNPMENIFYNGDDSLTATVIKNGVIAQRGDASKDSLVIYRDGRWEFPVNVSMSSADRLIKDGAIASVSYTYPVIWEGKKYKHPDAGVNTGIWTNHTIDKATNHTLIGKKGADKYYVLISQGFGTGYLAEYMLNNLGVEYAYWGNGGASAAMYVKGHGVITPYDNVVHGDLFCVR